MFLGALNALQPQYQTSVLDEERTRLSDRVDFDYRRRGRVAQVDPFRWVTPWPASRICSGDAAVPLGICGQVDMDTGWAIRWIKRCRGNGAVKFIMGQCKDAGGNAVGGAVVQGFLTATDAFVTETACDDKGYYELGTPNRGVSHYLVAYRAGSPDIAGTTVNTLVPTNRDGT